MRSFILPLLSSAALAATEYDFMSYITYHNKSYATLDEYHTRFQQYLTTDKVINEHNSSQNSYRLAHNKFSDRSESEMSQMYGDISIPERIHRETSKAA